VVIEKGREGFGVGKKEEEGEEGEQEKKEVTKHKKLRRTFDKREQVEK